MIEALKSDDLANRLGGRFKMCALVQRRLAQLMEGARPMVERHGRSDLEIAIEEIAQGKLSLEFDPAAEVDLTNCFPPDSPMLKQFGGGSERRTKMLED